jgi:Chaperone for flagella basal body P-ring formation
MKKTRMDSRRGNRLPAQIVFVAGALLMASGAAAQMRRPVALERVAVVRTDVVRLLDLLPEAAPPLRLRAREIVLGDAPVPGEARDFTREEVLHALRDWPALQIELQIPSDMEVRRWARRVTPEEVLAAIDRTLRANGSTAGESLTASDVHLAADVAITEDVPKLQVTQIQPAGGGNGTRLLVWVTSEPRVPPFWVRVDRSIDLDARRGTPTRHAEPGAALPVRANEIVPVSDRMFSAPARRANPLGEILVKAGDPVELVVQVGGMRIQGTGIPLDRGREGDVVRVRAATSGRILVGTVVGQQIVQVSF